MNESGSNEHTCTKVLAEKEDGRRNLHPFDLLSYHWETGTKGTGEEDND